MGVKTTKVYTCDFCGEEAAPETVWVVQIQKPMLEAFTKREEKDLRRDACGACAKPFRAMLLDSLLPV